MPTARCQLSIALSAAFSLVCATAIVRAQESATPTATPWASPSSTRSVPITFVPPPLDGTISLGIYNRDGNLVRVLHQEAELNEFTVESDGLETKWDGKNDDGEDLPPGKYNARGYAVGRLKIDDLGTVATALPFDAPEHVSAKLVSNPLSKSVKTVVDLAVGFDDQDCFLRTADGLPLITISETPDLMRAFLIKESDKSVDVFEDDGDTIDQFRVSNIDQMMAFDCGEVELK